MNKKIYRLITSKNYLKLVKIYHSFFGENFKKDIDKQNIYNDKIHRLDVIQNLIKKYNFKKYLEIGCDQNEVFSQVKIENKIGVDPVSGGTHRMTSDKFFISNTEKFDLIFVDGLHRYEQVRKDIINSLKCLNEKGIILFHDCFPLTYYDQACPRAQRKWNGDVWKAVVEFRTYENIRTYVGNFDNGIGMITNKLNDNPLKIDNKNFKSLKYVDYYNNYKNYLNLVNIEEFYNLTDER